MKVTLEITLARPRVDADTVEGALRYLYERGGTAVASFNLMLLRISKASTWELTKLSVTDDESNSSNQQPAA